VQSSSSGSSSSGDNNSSSSDGKLSSSSENDGNIYKTVEIGNQTWMAENLNYEVGDSKCYNDDPANCDKYGRLYDWTTAMALPSKCSNILSASDADCTIKTPHKGICPTGYHIPTNTEWDKLMRYVDGNTGTSSPYNSTTAGKYLKAKEGWYDHCVSSGGEEDTYSGEDTYGFSALPGGGGYGSIFGNAGVIGHWWSSSEISNRSVYQQGISCGEAASCSVSEFKSYLFSIRCVRD
jgi:uncharacterized protein (TIGR02145 family)